MTFDPKKLDLDEEVTLGGNGKMTLRSAVTKIMAAPIGERVIATIFREGEPSILDFPQIEAIASLPNFKMSDQ